VITRGRGIARAADGGGVAEAEPEMGLTRDQETKSPFTGEPGDQEFFLLKTRPPDLLILV
jgi:hypothetical protein